MKKYTFTLLLLFNIHGIHAFLLHQSYDEARSEKNDVLLVIASKPYTHQENQRRLNEITARVVAMIRQHIEHTQRVRQP